MMKSKEENFKQIWMVFFVAFNEAQISVERTKMIRFVEDND